jgi:hypothetical protein
MRLGLSRMIIRPTGKVNALGDRLKKIISCRLISNRGIPEFRTMTGWPIFASFAPICAQVPLPLWYSHN